VHSHLPLPIKILWVKSSHFNRNLHDWDFHVRPAKVPKHIYLLLKLLTQIPHVDQ